MCDPADKPRVGSAEQSHNASVDDADRAAAKRKTARRRRYLMMLITLVSLAAFWGMLNWMLDETVTLTRFDASAIEGRATEQPDTGSTDPAPHDDDSTAPLQDLLDGAAADTHMALPWQIDPPERAVEHSRMHRNLGSVREIILSYDVAAPSSQAVLDHFNAQADAAGFVRVSDTTDPSRDRLNRPVLQATYMRPLPDGQVTGMSDDVLTVRIRSLDATRVRAVLWMRYPIDSPTGAAPAP